MKKTAMLIAPIMLFCLVSASTASAGESISMTISCTIPAIPGLNTPMVEEEVLRTESPVETQTDYQKETLAVSSSVIQQDSQEEKIITEGKESFLMVKTIYDR